MNKKNKRKIILGSGILSAGAVLTAVIVPIALNLTYQEKQSSIFEKPVKFMGKTFSSKSQILSYINQNSSKLMKKANANIYSAKIGKDTVDFYAYSDAINFIKTKVVSKEVYLKPGVENLGSASIGPESFIETQNTRKYVVFKKYSSIYDRREQGGKMEHSYTFALLPRSEDSEETKNILREKIEKARMEAAKSYIQVHTAYYFNGIYFKTTNDLRRYLNQNRSILFKNIVGGSSFSVINTERGLIKFKTNKNGLENNAEFRNRIKDFAVPYYNTAFEGQPPKWVRVDQAHKLDISQTLSENELRYIKVNSNDDEATEVVDMDGSTPNGMLYGNYFIKSGLGMSESTKKDNWKIETNIKPSSSKELTDIVILKSIINFAFNSHKIQNLIDLIQHTLIPGKSLSFMEFLGSNNFKHIGYDKDATNLIRNLSKGVRNNFLDSIIATHSFLINKMIKNNENSEDIIMVSQYFDSMAKIMDSFVAPLILPFLVNKKINANTKFSYFSDAFKFYDEKSIGLGISFQNNPYSYYKKLLGNDNQNKDRMKRKIYFKILKASMGMQSIMLRGLRHNQVIYSKWENKQEEKIKNTIEQNEKIKERNKTNKTSLSPYPQSEMRKESEKNIEIDSLNFTKKYDDSKLFDFSFSGYKKAKLDSKEWISIWKNLNDIQESIEIDNVKITPDTIIKNANDYIVKYQNNAIKKYKEQLNSKKDLIFEKYNNRTNVEFHEEDFNTNTFCMIPLSSDAANVLKSGQTIASDYDGYIYLNEMISSAVRPLKDRVKDFATNVGTFAAQFTIALVSADASAEGSLVKEAIKGGGKSNMTWAFKGRKSNLGTTIKNMSTKNKYKLSKDIFKTFPTGTVKNSPANSFVKEFIRWNNPALLILGATNNKVKEIIDDALDVVVGIAKNVLPGLSILMGIVDNFNTSEKQTYKFKGAEDQTQLLWDGGRVDYSWWGLHSKQVYSIKDLEIIVTPEIISGFSNSEDGYYFGNKIHSDLGALKIFVADQKINSLLNEDRSKFIAQSKNKIKWGLPLQNQNDDKVQKYDNIGELIKNMSELAKQDVVSEKIYISSDGLRTSTNKAWDSNLESFLASQKRSLIIKMPKKVNGELRQDKFFELPRPFFENGVVNKLDKQNKLNLTDNSRYITLNPNINIVGENEKEKIKSIASKRDESKVDNPSKYPQIYNKYKKILKIMEDASNSSNFSTSESLNKLIEKYAIGLRIDNKEIIYNVLNNPQNLSFNSNVKSTTKGTYEYLDDSWTQKSKIIYKINSKSGQVKYFLTKKQSLLELKDKEFEIHSTTLNRDTIKYLFNGILFNSINEMYNYIIKETGGK